MKQVQLHHRIKIIRKEKGFTLKTIAKRTGLSVSFLSEFERGNCNASLRSLEKIANALGIAFAELVSGTQIKTLEIPESLFEAQKTFNISKAWVETLQNINYKGRQLSTKEEWYALYIYLKGVFS